MRQECGLSVGMRVQVGGDRGTVAYVGLLQGHGDGVWIGIEWDRVERGKHDGTVDGVRYWQCDGQRGSFVKMKKVGNGGRCSLIDAVRMRYVQQLADEGFRSKLTQVGGGVVQIEEKKVPGLGELEVVDVSQHGVCSVGDVSELESVSEVTVSKCLLGRMSEVCEIAQRLRTVRYLDASHNVLHDGEEATEARGASALEEAVLNHCSVSWEGVAYLCNNTRALRVLRLHDCGLQSLNSGTWMRARTSLHALEKVDVSGNELQWEDVLALGELASLREAYVGKNGLKDRAIERDGVFRELRVLSLSDNQLDGWRVIDWLNSLPQLTQLWVRGNGIVSEDAAALAADRAPPGRLRVVGRVASLRKLDGSAICADERLFGERRYAREVAAAVHALGLTEARKQHSRADELLRLADVVSTAALATPRAPMVTLRVRDEGGGGGGGDDDDVRFERQLPRSTPLRRATRLIRRALRSPQLRLGVQRHAAHVHWLSHDDELLHAPLSQLAAVDDALREHVSVVAQPL